MNMSPSEQLIENSFISNRYYYCSHHFPLHTFQVHSIFFSIFFSLLGPSTVHFSVTCFEILTFCVHIYIFTLQFSFSRTTISAPWQLTLYTTYSCDNYIVVAVNCDNTNRNNTKIVIMQFPLQFICKLYRIVSPHTIFVGFNNVQPT